MRPKVFQTAVLATLLISGTAMAKPIMPVHKTIFLCADEPNLLEELKSRLAPDVVLIDGQDGHLPPDWSGVTLVIFGRHDGAAAQCARQHPRGETILELVRVDAEISKQEFEARMKKLMGDKIKSFGPLGQFNDRDQGEVASWFADICFAETSAACDFDGPSEFVRLVSEPSPAN